MPPPERLASQFRRLRIELPQPWSRRLGQLAYLPQLARRDAETVRAFAEEPVIEDLVADRTPLEGVGVGLSERVIEVPWVLRSLPASPGARILDVGTAFSPIPYKRLVVRLPHTVEVVDLAEAEIHGLKTHVADIRNLPFGLDSFDVAICVSTLEHIGMDNTNYQVASGGGGDVEALRELGRVARVVFVTVPAGEDADMGWQRQYSLDRFRKVVAEAGLQAKRIEVFAHDPVAGWSPAPEESVAGRTYGQGATAAAAVICTELTRLEPEANPGT